MFIREVSDLHLEHHYNTRDGNDPRAQALLSTVLPPLPEDPETVLIVGGDLATARQVDRIVTFIGLVVPRFKHVIYVLGNHEHYGMYMVDTIRMIKESVKKKLGKVPNLTIAGNKPARIQIDGVTFIAGTLWTDYGGEDAINTHSMIRGYINDHRMIMGEDGKGMDPPEMIKIHRATLKTMENWMKGKDNSRTVICTHHMPTFSAVAEKYKNPHDPVGAHLNHAFASDLDAFILKHQPAAWTFGHTHTSYFGKIGNTQLICNPHGYPMESNLVSGEFDPLTRFEV